MLGWERSSETGKCGWIISIHKGSVCEFAVTSKGFSGVFIIFFWQPRMRRWLAGHSRHHASGWAAVPSWSSAKLRTCFRARGSRQEYKGELMNSGTLVRPHLCFLYSSLSSSVFPPPSPPQSPQPPPPFNLPSPPSSGYLHDAADSCEQALDINAHIATRCMQSAPNLTI